MQPSTLSLASNLINKLKEHNLTISAAESITGGLFSAALTSVPGASTAFLGSIVAYSPIAKVEVLQVSPAILRHYETVSPEMAQSMAIRAKQWFNSKVAISFTGNAGPDPVEGKPVGQCFMGVSLPDGQEIGFEFKTKSSERVEIQIEIVEFALNSLFNTLFNK